MKTYEIRDAIVNCDFGGSWEHYDNFIELKAASREEAFAEAEALQAEHDARHEAQYGQDEAFHNAPSYVANIYEDEVLLER